MDISTHLDLFPSEFSVLTKKLISMCGCNFMVIILMPMRIASIHRLPIQRTHITHASKHLFITNPLWRPGFARFTGRRRGSDSTSTLSWSIGHGWRRQTPAGCPRKALAGVRSQEGKTHGTPPRTRGEPPDAMLWSNPKHRSAAGETPADGQRACECRSCPGMLRSAGDIQRSTHTQPRRSLEVLHAD